MLQRTHCPRRTPQRSFLSFCEGPHLHLRLAAPWQSSAPSRASAGRAEGRKTALGFEEAAKLYLARLGEEGGKNISAKERQLRQHLSPFFRGKPIAQIETFDIERYKKARTNSGAAPATVNRELAVLSHLLNKAVEWRLIKAKSAKINRFKERNGRFVYLTDEQCAALLEAAAHDPNENVHSFIMVGLHTGMRHSEILAVRRADVNLDQRVIWIPKAKAGARWHLC